MFLRLTTFAATLSAALLAGCSEAQPERVAVHRVSGQVTVNGKPAPGATIVFHSKIPGAAPAPRAVADRAGNFQVTTFETGDGAPVGEYVVTVDLRPMVSKNGEFVAGPSQVPAKYHRAKTSDLKVRVVDGDNTVPLKIVR